MKVGDEDPEEEWTDIEGVVSARAGWGRRFGGEVCRYRERRRERRVDGAD